MCLHWQVTTVSPTYAADAMGGGGGALRETLGRKDVRAKFRVCTTHALNPEPDVPCGGWSSGWKAGVLTQPESGLQLSGRAVQPAVGSESVRVCRQARVSA
jgi:hypothetical protein